MTNQGYGNEVVWRLDSLNLMPGHTYRLQFMVHDGDQNKVGGDCGEACTTITMPASFASLPTTIVNQMYVPEEPTMNEQLKIYPNPAAANVVFSVVPTVPGNSLITMYDINGNPPPA